MDVGFVSGRATPGPDAHWPGRIAMDFSSLYLPLCGWCPTSRPPKKRWFLRPTNMDRNGETEKFPEKRNENEAHRVFFFLGGEQTVLTKNCAVWYLGYMLPQPGCQSSPTRMMLHVFWVRGFQPWSQLLLEEGAASNVCMVLWCCYSWGVWWWKLQERIEGLGQVECAQNDKTAESVLNIRGGLYSSHLFPCFKYKSICGEPQWIRWCELQGRSTPTNTGWTNIIQPSWRYPRRSMYGIFT